MPQACPDQLPDDMVVQLPLALPAIYNGPPSNDLSLLSHPVGKGVRDGWCDILSNDNNEVSDRVNMQTPFSDLRGDLLTAAQLANCFRSRGFQVTAEDMGDYPSMAS